MFIWLGAILGCCCLGPHGGAGGPDPAARRPGRTTLLADFDGHGATPAVHGPIQLQAGPGRPGSAGRGGAVEMPATARSVGQVVFPVPSGAALEDARALRAWARVGAAAAVRSFRWLAQDGAGRTLFQRPWKPAGDGVWRRVEWPLAVWRWGRQLGRWAEVRQLALQFETKNTRLELDDVELVGGGAGAALGGTEWVTAMAGRQGGRAPRTAVAGEAGRRVLVWTDGAGDAAGMEALARRISGAVCWIDRMFGDAVRPIGEGQPVPLLVFGDRAAYREFVGRLGQAWRVQIRAPQAGGYTVQDIAASSWKAEAGWRRPVYLHETVHAVVARRLRVAARATGADWFQEGLANYLQLAVYPDSFPTAGWKRLFRAPVGEGGGPVPLAELCGHDVPGERYAQAASVIGWLVAAHPDWLPTLARALAAGKGPDGAFQAAGSSVASAQREWEAWAVQALKGLPDGAQRHFPLPKEFGG